MIGAAPQRAAARQQSQFSVIPAPASGLDVRRPAAADRADVCLMLINMVPSEYGLRARDGYREWAIGIGTDDEVRTLLPYTDPDGTVKLFVATETGIYDVTTHAGAPTLKLTFAVQNADTGYGVYQNYVDQSGDGLLFYADEANGLFTYDPGTDTWAQATGITSHPDALGSIDITKINYVVHHKLRIWLVERDSDKAWYLPINAKSGEAREFFFGRNFRQGGHLVGLYNWSVDGGSGRDDMLVAISSTGDVTPYRGDDPAVIGAWSIIGTFYIGEVPRGTRIATSYGGDLFLLSTYGLISMTDLVSGGMVTDQTRGIGEPIARLLRNDLDSKRTLRGWQVLFAPATGALVITVPQTGTALHRQYVYTVPQGGWSLFRGVPMNCAGVHNNTLFFGNTDGRVHAMDVQGDNQTIANDPITPIRWFILSTFFSLGSGGAHKRVHFVRPNFTSIREPAYRVDVVYDYGVGSELAPVLSLNQDAAAIWDTSLWDSSIWTGSEGVPEFSLRGTTDMGRTAAIAMAGANVDDLFFTGWDVAWETGGFL